MNHDKIVTLYVTFGVQYHQTTHSYLPEANPDGWLEIQGFNYTQARSIANAITGGQFAFDYLDGDFEPVFFPDGAFMTITATRDSDEPKHVHYWAPQADGMNDKFQTTFIMVCPECGAIQAGEPS